MNKNLFVVVSKEFYYYSVEDDCVCPVKRSWFWRLIRKVVDLLGLPYPEAIISPKIAASTGKLVFSDAAYGGNDRLLNTIRKVTGRRDQILYYMNIVDDINIKFMETFAESQTFDKNDSLKYGIRHTIFPYTDYYSRNIATSDNYTYDLIFLGRSKGRLDLLIDIKHRAEENGMITKFMVLDTDNEEVGIKKYIDYQAYMKMVKETKCLVEILQDGQEGSSLRVKEALFLKKKLITNNKALISEWFYDYPNMYILGVDERDFTTFIKGSYVDNDIDLNKLKFSHWINTF